MNNPFVTAAVQKADKPQWARGRVLAVVVALALPGIFAALQVSTWPLRLRYPGEIGLVEGVPLAEMIHLRQGVRIYDPPLPERFDGAVYGPLYYLLGSRLINPDAPAYFPLRVLSMLATLGLAGCGGILAYWLARSYLAGLLAALIFLSCGFVTFYGASSRADSLALLLMVAGVLWMYRFRESRLLLAGVPLMLAGFFYKQQFVAGPLAVVAFLVLEKQFRRAWQLAGILALGGLGLLALFQWVVFPGQAFLRHFFLYNILLFSRQQFVGGLIIFGVTLLVPLLVGLEFLRVRPNRFLACYLVIAVLMALSAVSKEGSDTNYFLEPILIVSVLFAALVAKRVFEAGRVGELLVLLVVAILTNQLFTPAPPRPADFARDRAVQEYLRRSFAPHTLAMGFYPGDLVRAGLTSPFTDLFKYAQLVRNGTLRADDLESSVRRRRFGVIIMTFDLQAGQDEGWLKRFLTEPVRIAILENYQPAVSLDLPGPEKFHRDDKFYAWVPRPRTPGTGQVAPHD
jgi:hypothetical protein